MAWAGNKPIFPPIYPNTSASTQTLNSSNPRYAICYVPPAVQSDKSVQYIQFYVSAISTSGSVTAGLQLLNTSGVPDGTYLSSGSITVSSTGLKTVTLSSSVTISRNSFVAAVLETSAASISIAYTTIASRIVPVYRALYTTSWAKAAVIPSIYMVTSSDEVIPQPAPQSTVAYNSTSDPDERGTRITVPFPCKVVGAMAIVDYDAGCDLKLYLPDSSSYSCSYTNVYRVGTSVEGVAVFCPEYTASIGDQFIVSALPTTGTNITAYYYNYYSAAISAATWPAYESIQGVQRTDGGSWSTNNYPIVAALILSDITTSGGGGSGGISRCRALGGM